MTLKLAGWTLAAAALLAQGHAQAPLKFEVATIKPSKSAGSRGGLDILPGGALEMEGITLKGLVAFAYGIEEDRVLGGPKWAGSAVFDVHAKPEHAAPADLPGATVAPGTTAWDRARLRMQSLLEDRFGLAIRRDSKESSGFFLVIGKDGPKLKASQDAGNASTMRAPGRIDARRGTMTMLAVVLTSFLGRPVEDRTGLAGTYDYKLEYTQDPAPGETMVQDASRPSIYKAVEEQLGLKLEPARVAVVTIAIERATRPTAN